MVDGAGETAAFRLWPPVAIGAPFVVGWLATLLLGDPVDLGGWGLVLFPAAVLLVRWGAIRPEERFLRERFGSRYDDYTRRVRRWL
jgi:protein-S-isoprenylcysteine O-methyltransferase Ste14